MLPKKQRSNQADWLKVLRSIDNIIDKKTIEALVDQSLSAMKKVIRNKRVAFGWSGGKDSLAIQYLCKELGFQDCVFGVSNLEYPAFLQWSTDYMPDELEVINNGWDLIWLSDHQDMLFPKDAATAAKWFKGIQHYAQGAYFKKHRLDYIILGRRKSDGNYCGTKGSNIYTNQQGICRYSPIDLWTHEQTLRWLSYNNIRLPPNYFWPRGFRVGTGAWPARQWTNSIEHGWSEIFEIDSTIVYQAASFIPSAKEFLNNRGLN